MRHTDSFNRVALMDYSVVRTRRHIAECGIKLDERDLAGSGNQQTFLLDQKLVTIELNFRKTG